MPFDHFDKIASLYNRAAKFTLDETLLGILNPKKDSFVLDAGGGTGRVAAEIRPKVKQVVVADVSIGMLRFSVEKGLPCICAPAENLPFSSSTFDRIIMVDALHHVYNQRESVFELWRLLVTGGKLLIIEPDIKQFAIKLIALGEKLLLMRSHFLSGEQIAGIFDQERARVEVQRLDNNVIITAEKL